MPAAARTGKRDRLRLACPVPVAAMSSVFDHLIEHIFTLPEQNSNISQPIPTRASTRALPNPSLDVQPDHAPFDRTDAVASRRFWPSPSRSACSNSPVTSPDKTFVCTSTMPQRRAMTPQSSTGERTGARRVLLTRRDPVHPARLSSACGESPGRAAAPGRPAPSDVLPPSEAQLSPGLHPWSRGPRPGRILVPYPG